MAVIEWDRDFRVSRWNPAAHKMFGFSQAEAIGQHACFIVPEKYRHHVNDIWESLITRNGGERSTNENVCQNGTTILCEWYNTPLIDDDGICTGVASLVQDITEQRKSQELLAWEKKALELSCTSASLKDVLNEFMLGLEKQLPGALCSVLLLDNDGIHLSHGAAPSLPESYNRAIHGLAIGPTVGSCGTAAYSKNQVIVADISCDPLWAPFADLAIGHDLRACWSTPINGNEGKVLGTFAIYYRQPRHPVTIELELVSRAVHITRIAIERKYSEQAIVTARDQAEKANLLKDEFIATVSHELRTPLTSILGWSKMLQDGGLDTGAIERGLLSIHRNALAQSRLVEDLLDFSRITAGRMQVNLELINLADVVAEAIDGFRPAAQAKQIKLVLSLSPALINGDAERINQVAFNIISNAVKFSEQGQNIEITVTAADSVARFIVRDHGIGIAMEFLPHMFMLFSQADSGSTRRFGGMGIGLTIVRKLVELHGGTVRAESEGEDKGTTIIVELPLHRIGDTDIFKRLAHPA